MVLSDLVSRLVNLVMGRLAEALEVRERGRGQGARVGPPSFAPRPPILFFFSRIHASFHPPGRPALRPARDRPAGPDGRHLPGLLVG